MNFKKPSIKSVAEYAITAIILVATLIMFLGIGSREYSFAVLETSNISYVSGRVTKVVSEDLSDSNENSYTTGRQELLVEILEGETKGDIVEITSFITPTYQVILEEGSEVIVRADIPQGLEPYYTIYSYNRTLPVMLIIAFFLLLILAVGRKKGFMSCVGLLFTLAMVICYLLPRLYEGEPPFITIFITVVLSASASCFCISGISKRTYFNLLSVIIGSFSATFLYWIFTIMLNITDATLPEAENLLLVSYSTDLSLTGILFAGVTISALGAVMDVAVSLGASLWEIKTLDPKITSKELFRSGMNIGREMIGTMTNTLILAFAGGTLASLLIFISYGIQFDQLISSDFMALELATGIAGSSAVVLTVPISALVCAFGLGIENKKKRGNLK